ncbi:MAG: sulfocyanin-like copper-binding protein [Candidatus Sericytochromatia bacterium]
MRSQRLWLVVAIAIASVVLGIGTTAILHAAMRFGRSGPIAAPSCAAPALPGTVVDVTVTDMGAMMGPGMRPGMRGMRMMRLWVNPTTVPAGEVSLRVLNTGTLAHEAMLLPLPQGQQLGQRVSGPDGEVDESGNLGGASHTCSAGHDDEGNMADGIAPGAVGWTSMTLPAGRYEVICNIAGHYASGMYAELDVIGSPR